MKQEIQYIDINRLHNHPDNPRKNIGDISEMTDSIRERGILQPLTVIQDGGYYYPDYIVIIGHRRLAAAKAAQLNTVPCIIAEMSEKEQIATMLLENMQRSDLTLIEEAQGMQMMIDLGDSIEDVAKSTGLSASTIRRRVRLLQLDQEAFKKTESRQIDIVDYDRLFDIEDAKKRNEVLESIGTNNFNYNVSRAIDAQKAKQKLQEIAQKLYPFAKKTDSTTGLKHVCNLSKPEDELPPIMEDVQYYYKESDYGGYIYLYREPTPEEEEETANSNIKRNTVEAKRDEIREQWKDISERTYNLRRDFILDNRNVKQHKDTIMKYAATALLENLYSCCSWERLGTYLGLEAEHRDAMYDKVRTEMSKNCEYTLMVVVYWHMNDCETDDCTSWNCEYRKDEGLQFVYDFLVDLGYEMSDEEKAMMDGTHSLYDEAEALKESKL